MTNSHSSEWGLWLPAASARSPIQNAFPPAWDRYEPLQERSTLASTLSVRHGGHAPASGKKGLTLRKIKRGLTGALKQAIDSHP